LYRGLLSTGADHMQLPAGAQVGSKEALPATIGSVRSKAAFLEENKNYEASAQVWQEFIRLHPDDAEAINELGIVFICSSRYEEGLACFRQALKMRPDLIAARTNAGVALRHLGKIQDAISEFQEVAEATPDDAFACFNLGTLLHLAGQYDDALAWLQKAADLCPSHGQSAVELGKVLENLTRHEEAIQAYRRAILLKPDCIEAVLNLALLLDKAEHFDEAATLLQKVVESDPNDCDGWLRLGSALQAAKRHAEALAAYRKALAIQPSLTVGYCNMSLALVKLGRIEEAIEACKKAIFIEPASPVANFNLGAMLLTIGNFRDGWQAYNYRYAMHGEQWLRDEVRAVPWTGEALAGKSILILGEQGNGDQIQFARYLPELSNLGARVFYLASERLHRLFLSLGGSVTLLSEIPEDSHFDFQCPLMSLPGVFETLGLPIPNKTPYLGAEPERIVQWKTRIGDQGFRVGIVWQGARYDGNDVRSYPLAAVRPLAAIPGIRLLSLQINGGTEQLENLSRDIRVESLGPDFDSAAVIEVVDLIISCDTSMVHVAGALGRPVWIALSEAPEWRWQLERSDSIWYPTARLFRRESGESWEGLFLRMAEALRELIVVRTSATVNEADYLPKSPPRVEVSWGELLDKISILEIKAERMTSRASAANVRRELEHLNSTLSGLAPLPLYVKKKYSSLRATNEKLWDLEDAVRVCESDKRFDSHFVELARNIYKFNDERAKLKQEINAMTKSAFVEEKQHSLRRSHESESPPTRRANE
jgi:tetratricopeptide (TPR) repeat protein